MAYNILVLNIGSTSFKFKYYDMESEEVIASGRIESVFNNNSKYTYDVNNKKQIGEINTVDGYEPCIDMMAELVKKSFVGGIETVKAIGFKTVMAGDINRTCELDNSVIDKMKEYSTVAPAHNTPYIDAVKYVRKIFPQAVLVGSFETAFHNTMPSYASMYPIDSALADKYGIRKYGFHGAAHSYVAYKLNSYGHRKIISVHLGGSSSVCAIKDGISVDTSMGFSPQSGLPMNNRCGDLDVFALLYIMEKENMAVEDTRIFLSTKCGLMGMSGVSNDIRKIEKSGSFETIEAYTYAISKYICSFLASLGGIDAISFSGGIGENSRSIKNAVCKRLKFLGVKLSREKMNRTLGSEPLLISDSDSKVKVYTTPIDEEIMVARNTYNYLMKG